MGGSQGVSVHECVRAFGTVSGSARLLRSFMAPILRSCEIQRVTHTHSQHIHHTHTQWGARPDHPAAYAEEGA